MEVIRRGRITASKPSVPKIRRSRHRNLRIRFNIKGILMGNRLCNQTVFGYEYVTLANELRPVINTEGGPQQIFFKRSNLMLFAPKEKGQGLVEYAIILAL